MENYTGFEIAVIGVSGRFPGSKDVKTFWENIKNGVESISFFTDEELLEEGETKANVENPAYVKANSYLKEKENFDANFFGYLPVEAKLMDPQMRILHECVWQVIEDAGYDLDTVKSRIGLFLGASSNLNWENYAVLANRENLIDNYSLKLLSDVNNASTRISYLLNLRGPSISINTACSTSLVCIHQACNSLLLGESNMAIAGGIAINNFSKRGYIYQEGMIFSKDGHCRPFDADSNGINGGEGVGLVMLKRLKNAMKDGDRIYGIIKGTGINNDGNDKVGYTAPSVDGQTEAIMMARKMAKVKPESITYVEAHGTATKLGDPIEVEALTQAFGRSEKPYCALGSVKSNIGHLDAAAGVAGFIKALMAIKNRQIPPSLNFKKPNPRIDFNRSPFYVNNKLQEWNNEDYPLRAGVSSFGIGGTNAHVILEEAPSAEPSSASRDYQLLPLSAKTPSALKSNIGALQEFLEEQTDLKLADVAYTLQVGRTDLAYRAFFVAKDRVEAIEKLKSWKPSIKPEALLDRKSNIAFLFSGQGAQYAGMGLDLYEKEPLFRKEMDHCFDLLKRFTDTNFKAIIFADTESELSAKINQTEYTQPLLFILEYAVAKLLMAWGIQPNVLLGHSIGEYVAACLSGVFSLEDALRIVVKRGGLMQKLPKGKMLSIAIAEEKLLPLLHNFQEVDLAAVNSSENCVVSGENAAIDAFKIEAENKGFLCKEIRTSHAFHSRMMDGVLEEFEEELKQISFGAIQIPFISNVTGKPATDAEVSQAKYWVNHLRHTVKYEQGIGVLLQQAQMTFIEVGPGKTLNSLLGAHRLKTRNHKTINLVRHPKEKTNDLSFLLGGLGQLWSAGITPNWSQFYENEFRRKVSLPTYSFDKIKYPAIVNSYEMIAEMTRNQLDMKNEDLSKWLYAPSWKLSAGFLKSSGFETSNCTLMFADDLGLSTALQKKVAAHTDSIICVKIADQFKKISPLVYEVNPSAENDIHELYKHLAEQQLVPDRLIHAWSFTAEKETMASKIALDHSLFSLVNIIKAHHDTFKGNFLKQIVLLTANLHDVFNEKIISPVKSMALGLLKVLPQEFPSLRVNSVNVDLEEPIDEKLINNLYRELTESLPGRVVSYRNKKRWEQTYDRIPSNGEPIEQAFKQHGVYLITGGTGKLGFSLAENLMKQFEAKVVLLGRTVLPNREGWEDLLAKGVSSELNEKTKQIITRILALEKSKGELLYLNGDVADFAAMEKAVLQVEEKFDQINGVIHAAGIVDGPSLHLLTHLTKADFENQLTPKLKGVEVLRKVMESRTLDFCLLTSSLSVILGGLRFGAYGAANTAMDYYLNSFRNNNQLENWVSVNLDGLNFDRSVESNFINEDELLEVFNSAISLKANFPQILVSTTDLSLRLDQSIYNIASKETEDEAMQTDVSTEDDSFVVDESLSPTEKELMILWQSFLGKPDLTIEDSFFEIGGDSLKALTIIQRIQKQFDLQLTISEFFEKPTIQALASYIEAQQWLSKKPAANKVNKIEITI